MTHSLQSGSPHLTLAVHPRSPIGYQILSLSSVSYLSAEASLVPHTFPLPKTSYGFGKEKYDPFFTARDIGYPHRYEPPDNLIFSKSGRNCALTLKGGPG